MATAGLSRALEFLRLELLPDPGETDGQLLARFVTMRDETAFAALVRRYEPLVFGVCRRVLHNHHDSEDAFQATFLVLARKADSVAKRETLSCWLARVAYHVALEVRAVNARRQARQRPLAGVPHPQVPPSEPQDWRPVLDEELNRLPEKYRTAIVLCDLEGRPRKEAAGLLGLPEGTLSSRLAMGRKMLGERLTRRGVALTGAALTAALSPAAASAGVSSMLMTTTLRAAMLVAAGDSAAATTPAAILMKGVLQTMFLQKLKIAMVAVMATVALGAGGFVYQAGTSPSKAQAQAAPAKPQNELEALRKENELLKLNLQVVLEKVRAQEEQLKALKDKVAILPRKGDLNALSEEQFREAVKKHWNLLLDVKVPPSVEFVPDPLGEAMAALKAFQNAKDPQAKLLAALELEKASMKLREQLKGPAAPRKK
jgi:RNA polymerase sigma factor (sigma-70 family)